MNKIKRISCVVLALVLALSVFIIPTTAAADPYANFSLKMAPVYGETDDNGMTSEEANVYKITLSVASNVRLSAIVLDILYDENMITPLNLYEGAVDYTYPADADYPEIVYTLADTNAYDKNGNVLASGRAQYYGFGHASCKTTKNMSYKDAGVALFSLICGDKSSMPGGSGEVEEVGSLYFTLNEGVTAADLENMELGFSDGTGSTDAFSIAYDATPTLEKFYTTAGSLSTNMTSNSVKTEGVYKVLTAKTSQIKFYSADKFAVRARANFYKSEFLSLFENNDNAEDKIVDAGFIYAAKSNEATFDVAKAQALAKSTNEKDGNYVKYSCKWIQETDEYYMFTCVIDNIPVADKADGVYAYAYVAYDLGDGVNYLFYDAETEISYTTLYDAYSAEALA